MHIVMVAREITLETYHRIAYSAGTITNVHEEPTSLKLVGCFRGLELIMQNDMVEVERGEKFPGLRQAVPKGKSMHCPDGEIQNVSSGPRKLHFSDGIRVLTGDNYIDPALGTSGPLSQFQLAVQGYFFSNLGELEAVKTAAATLRKNTSEHEELIGNVIEHIEQSRVISAICAIKSARVQLGPTNG